MEYRRLGKSGLNVSAQSFGAWVTFGTQLDVSQALALMRAAYERGCNFFDNAESYAQGQAEQIMGEALQTAGWRRDSYLVSSKVYFGSVENPSLLQRGLSRKHIVEACYQALERLKCDYLDLYFCHRPDPTVPIEETVRAMNELIQRGDVLYWGTSEWSAQQIMEAYGVARQYGLIPPTMEQPQYNMFHRHRVEHEYARLYSPETVGLGTTIWSPLASGMLTGKYNEGIPAGSRATLKGYEWVRQGIQSDEGRRDIEKVKQLEPLARELGCSLAQLGIAWCLRNPRVSTVITGASRPEQVHENMKALEVLPRLTPEVMDRIETILNNNPCPDQE